MTTMIERVGRAVMRDALGDRRGYRQTWDGIDDDIQEEIIEAVGRAAIEAMREADDPMLIAGVRIVRAEGMISDSLAGMVWRSMIDKALAEGERG